MIRDFTADQARELAKSSLEFVINDALNQIEEAAKGGLRRVVLLSPNIWTTRGKEWTKACNQLKTQGFDVLPQCELQFNMYSLPGTVVKW